MVEVFVIVERRSCCAEKFVNLRGVVCSNADLLINTVKVLIVEDGSLIPQSDGGEARGSGEGDRRLLRS